MKEEQEFNQYTQQPSKLLNTKDIDRYKHENIQHKYSHKA